MKVLHVIPSIAPCRGGPSEAVLAMCRALCSQGVEAEIVTTNDDGPNVLPLPTGDFIDYQGVRVCFLPRWSPRMNALREFQYAPSFADWLRGHTSDYAGLHVHAVFSYLPTHAMKIARLVGKPYIARPLGQLDPWSLSQQASKKRLYYRLIERENLLHASAIQCTSATEGENVSHLLPNTRVVVIPHGIEPIVQVPTAAQVLRATLGIPTDQRVLLFLSRWAAKKNIPLLLEALSDMKNERWHLVLAGTASDGYENVVRQMIDDAGLLGRVSCPGHVVGDLKALLLRGADVFVLPSITENFGVSVAEALCCGLRTVVTPGVDIAPVVRELDGGTVCEANPKALAAALTLEFRHTGNREALAEAAGVRFSWSSAAAKLRTLYEEVFN